MATWDQFDPHDPRDLPPAPTLSWDEQVLDDAAAYEARARDRRRHFVLAVVLLAAFLLGMLCPYVWVHA